MLGVILSLSIQSESARWITVAEHVSESSAALRIDASLANRVLLKRGIPSIERVLWAARARIAKRNGEDWVVPVAPTELTYTVTRAEGTPRQRAEAFLRRWDGARGTATSDPGQLARERDLYLGRDLAQRLSGTPAGWLSEGNLYEGQFTATDAAALSDWRSMLDSIGALYQYKNSDPQLAAYGQL